MIYSFLLIGQSNAAGRGFLSEAEPLDNLGGRLKVLRNGRWQSMFRPVNPDRPFAGVSFSESFARQYALSNPDAEVGIIPCADGGTALEQWQPGGLLFDHAVYSAMLAMRTSVLAGILWHQGETDCAPECSSTYFERFKVMMDALRTALNISDLPVLVGGLGDFISLYKPAQEFLRVNDALVRLGNEYPHCAFVSAEGLAGNPDNLHFSTQAQQEFGVRYFEKYKEMHYNPSSRMPTVDDTKRTEMELL